MKLKRTLALALALALVFALMIPAASLAEGNGRGHAYGNRGAVNAAQLRKVERMVEKANVEIELLVAYAQLTPWNDVQWLIEKTNAVANEVLTYARRAGITVLCEYTQYYVDGQYVLIDPLRVVDV